MMLIMSIRVSKGEVIDNMTANSDKYKVLLSEKDRIKSLGSRGNQPKWFSGNFWYKADYCGYEGLAEYICSELLSVSSIKNYITYTPVSIMEVESAKEFKGCKSADFGTILTGEVILLNLPEKYNVFLNSSGSLEKDIHTFCDGIKEIFCVDVTSDLLSMLQFDLLVGNEDRILRNFGLTLAGNEYCFAPLFDHGISLLSDITTNERHENIEDIPYQPFNYRRSRGHGLDMLNIQPLVIDIETFKQRVKSIPVYDKNVTDRALDILRQSLTETEGILWVKP